MEFIGKKKGTNQLTIFLEPRKNYFVELKGNNSLWKVHPTIDYIIEDVENKKNNKLNQNNEERKEESKNSSNNNL